MAFTDMGPLSFHHLIYLCLTKLWVNLDGSAQSDSNEKQLFGWFHYLSLESHHYCANNSILTFATTVFNCYYRTKNLWNWKQNMRFSSLSFPNQIFSIQNEKKKDSESCDCISFSIQIEKERRKSIGIYIQSNDLLMFTHIYLVSE